MELLGPGSEAKNFAIAFGAAASPEKTGADKRNICLFVSTSIEMLDCRSLIASILTDGGVIL